jgi:hypothetical protein
VTQLEAFALTLAIEAAAAAALGRALKLDPLRCALAAAAASTVTHPILWAIHPHTYGYFGAFATPILEAAVIAAETPFYRALAARRWVDAALLSLVVNAASWGAGEVIYALT